MLVSDPDAGRMKYCELIGEVVVMSFIMGRGIIICALSSSSQLNLEG